MKVILKFSYPTSNLQDLKKDFLIVEKMIKMFTYGCFQD